MRLMPRPRQDEIRRIGRQLRLLREKSGRSLEQLASAAGLSPRAVRDLEAGRTNPALATVVGVVEALGVTLDEVMAAARRGWPCADHTPDTAAGSSVWLTRSLPEPRMKARLLTLDRAGRLDLPAGPLLLHVLQGRVVVTTHEGEVSLCRGDTLHAQPGVTTGIRDGGGRLMVVEAVQEPGAQQERA